jgi:predicted alpha/beta superfamily hydrolase
MKPYRKSTRFSTTLNRKVSFYFSSTLGPEEPGPLLILHDGQNLFDDKTAAYGCSWRVAEAMAQPGVPKMRVIGINNCEDGEGRLDEYSPFSGSKTLLSVGFARIAGGKGDLYLRYVMDEVVPHYTAMHPTTAIYMGGSSMGGFITLCAALSYPDRLAGVFGLSNAWWFAEKALLKRIETFSGLLPRTYLDTGDAESLDPVHNRRYVKTHHRIVASVAQKPSKAFRSEVIPGGIHHESAWAKRLADVLRWLIQSSK